MTRVFMTGFEAGHVAAAFSTQSGITVSTVQKRTGNYSALSAGANNSSAYIPLPASIAEVYVRVAVYPTAFTAGYYVCRFEDSASGAQISLAISGAGLLRLYKGTIAGTLLGTSVNALTLNAWSCIELHLLIDSTNGVGDVKIDGVLEIDFDGNTQATANANVRTFVLGGFAAATSNCMVGYFDDIAINNVAGSYNNSWIGRGGIYPCFPSGIGTYSQLTPNSAVDNYTCVDEKPPDDDTTYVSSADIDDQDSYEIDDLVPTAGTITAVQFLARARLTEAGAGNVGRLMRIGGVDYQGANLPIDTTTYKFCNEILETSPVAPGTTQFSIAEVNGMQVGVVVE